MNAVGRLVAATDDAGQVFTFAVCARCALRLDRLPVHIQRRQMFAAFRQISRHPERYPDLRQFPSRAAAHLFVVLEAEGLRAARP